MPNRLADSSSPYLRQHAANPVDWREWGDEAFGEARERDVPVLLSVGYAACHWCHVMAHESFDDDALAAQMNDGFVCIKVDREERPDIDALYMAATIAMTGHGGWPMTCFLTPDGQPFYCGTYYPPQPRGGQPGFGEVLAAISRTWRERRDDVLAAGERITEHLRANGAPLPSGELPGAAVIETALAKLLAAEDPRSSGFGGAPKFPPSATIEGLLRVAELGGREEALALADRIAAAMAAGGIYDQLAGGFARYSVDSDWVVPHFEKMLYDNALLVRAYAHLARAAGSARAAEVVAETIEFLDDALWTGHGYASSLDADTEGTEGATYVWTPEQLVDVLGEDDGRWAARTFAVTADGTFEHGTSVLQLVGDPDDPERFGRVRARLRAARDDRPQPARDDKVVTGWNALAITALAEAGAGLSRPDWIARAAECAEQLCRRHVAAGAVCRASLGGAAGDAPGALDDYAALATALLTLHQVTGELGWRDRGLSILDHAVERFADAQAPGSWFDATGEGLIARPRDPLDGATPSGASLVAEALLLAGQLADDNRAGEYLDLADATLARSGPIIERAPTAAGHWLAIAQTRIAGPVQVAVAQTAGSDGAFAAAIRRRAPGGVVVVAGAPDSIPLLAGRAPVAGADAAYICRGSVCSLPETDLDGVLSHLR